MAVMAERIRWRDYFFEKDAVAAEDLVHVLMGLDDNDTAHPGGSALSEQDRAIVLEQYKLYVEMADRVSSRRSLANTFFLTLNSAVLTVIGVVWNRQPDAAPGVAIVPLFVLVTQCLVWFWTVRSYRQLNSGKWAVVGALETVLPTSPWWAAEWHALGQGRDPGRYWPLTHLEQWVPMLFALAYVSGFLGLLLL